MVEARTEEGPSFVLLDKEGRIKSDGDRWGSAARDESLDKETWSSQKLTKRTVPLRSPREEKKDRGLVEMEGGKEYGVKWEDQT